MDMYASFGFIDIIVICIGVYGFYSWHMLVHKHEIKKTLLTGGNTTPEQCFDVEGFADFIGKKLFIFSATTVVFGGISAYNSYVAEVGAILWIGMAIFMGVIVWYCMQLRKADGLYFSNRSKFGKSGKSMKDKAMNK